MNRQERREWKQLRAQLAADLTVWRLWAVLVGLATVNVGLWLMRHGGQLPW